MATLEEEQKKIGDLLKKTREAKKKKLADIAVTLCIKERFLEALEAGNFKDLPGEPYVKGFIRSYSTYLGLNCDKIFIAAEEALDQPDEIKEDKKPELKKTPVQEIQKEVQKEPQKEFQKIEEQKELATLIEDDKARPYLWIIIGVLTVLVIALMFIPKKTDIAQAISEEKVVLENVIQTEESYVLEDEQFNKENVVSEDKFPPVPPKKPEVVDEVSNVEAYSGSGVIEQQNTADQPVVAEEQVPEEVYVPKVYGNARNPRIVAVALEKVWIEVRKQLPEVEEDVVDENGNPVHKFEILFSKELNTGDKYNVANIENLFLRTGNAGGINLYLDGNLLKQIGPRGSIRTISLNPEELAKKLEGEE